ncbi:MAG: hypothetical protein H0W12_00575 [Chitinophagaceae bacterium]|nr:hypothetical protein [Chitinophagaceae bacterium]
MKKLITFLFCICAFITSFAQYNQQNQGGYPNGDNRNRTYGDNDRRNNPYDNDRRNNQYGNASQQGVFNRNGNNDYANAARERDIQIARINQQFEYKVASIRNDRYTRRRDMNLMIKEAEIQRAQQINMINARYSNSTSYNNGYNNRNNDRYNNQQGNWRH